MKILHGFTNLFVLGLTQAGNLFSSITHDLTEAGTSIAAVVAPPARPRCYDKLTSHCPGGHRRQERQSWPTTSFR